MAQNFPNLLKMKIADPVISTNPKQDKHKNIKRHNQFLKNSNKKFEGSQRKKHIYLETMKTSFRSYAN